VAKRIVLVSDISGKAIETGQAAKVRITFEDGRRGVIELDATADELQQLVDKGRKVARRGRRPKSES
jgi:hypothetical protein